MPKKLTTEQFIERAKEVHADKYDYSLVNYVKLRTKVEIICEKHGGFKQTPEGHLNGLTCRKCTNDSKKTDVEEFISTCKEIHGNKYDYSKVDYINTITKVTLICKSHGEFVQTPNSHLQGHGCFECGHKLMSDSWRLTDTIFIRRSCEIHKNKYDYSLVNYSNNKTKVKIICPKHGVFEQVPSLHLRGTDCPKCSSLHKGYYSIKTADRNKKEYLKRKATLYLLNIFNNEENFYKIGITTTNLMTRFSGLSKKYSYKQVERVETNLYDAIYLENKILNLSKNKYKPKNYFYGETECFSKNITILK